MPRRNAQRKNGLREAGRKTANNAMNAMPLIAGGAAGAVIGAGVGVAAAAVMQNEDIRRNVVGVLENARERTMERMPYASRQTISNGHQRKTGMKMGRTGRKSHKKKEYSQMEGM